MYNREIKVRGMLGSMFTNKEVLNNETKIYTMAYSREKVFTREAEEFYTYRDKEEDVEKSFLEYIKYILKVDNDKEGLERNIIFPQLLKSLDKKFETKLFKDFKSRYFKYKKMAIADVQVDIGVDGVKVLVYALPLRVFKRLVGYKPNKPVEDMNILPLAII